MSRKALWVMIVLIAFIGSSCSANEIPIIGEWVVVNPSKDFKGIQSFLIKKEKDEYFIRIMDIDDFPLSVNRSANEYTFRVIGIGPDGPPEKLVLNGELLIHYVFVDSRWKEYGRYSRVEN
jgi:hypothetical protein